MKTNKNQSLLMSMVKSLVENDTKSATENLHTYLTNKTHNLVEKCSMENEEELEFDVTVDGYDDMDDLDDDFDVAQCCDMIKTCDDPEMIQQCCDDLQRYCDELKGSCDPDDMECDPDEDEMRF